jgi:hypothetical protein
MVAVASTVPIWTSESTDNGWVMAWAVDSTVPSDSRAVTAVADEDNAVGSFVAAIEAWALEEVSPL